MNCDVTTILQNLKLKFKYSSNFKIVCGEIKKDKLCYKVK